VDADRAVLQALASSDQELAALFIQAISGSIPNVPIFPNPSSPSLQDDGEGGGGGDLVAPGAAADVAAPSLPRLRPLQVVHRQSNAPATDPASTWVAEVSKVNEVAHNEACSIFVKLHHEEKLTADDEKQPDTLGWLIYCPVCTATAQAIDETRSKWIEGLAGLNEHVETWHIGHFDGAGNRVHSIHPGDMKQWLLYPYAVAIDAIVRIARSGAMEPFRHLGAEPRSRQAMKEVKNAIAAIIERFASPQIQSSTRNNSMLEDNEIEYCTGKDFFKGRASDIESFSHMRNFPSVIKGSSGNWFACSCPFCGVNCSSRGLAYVGWKGLYQHIRRAHYTNNQSEPMAIMEPGNIRPFLFFRPNNISKNKPEEQAEWTLRVCNKVQVTPHLLETVEKIQTPLNPRIVRLYRPKDRPDPQPSRRRVRFDLSLADSGPSHERVEGQDARLNNGSVLRTEEMHRRLQESLFSNSQSFAPGAANSEPATPSEMPRLSPAMANARSSSPAIASAAQDSVAAEASSNALSGLNPWFISLASQAMSTNTFSPPNPGPSPSATMSRPEAFAAHRWSHMEVSSGQYSPYPRDDIFRTFQQVEASQHEENALHRSPTAPPTNVSPREASYPSLADYTTLDYDPRICNRPDLTGLFVDGIWRQYPHNSLQAEYQNGEKARPDLRHSLGAMHHGIPPMQLSPTFPVRAMSPTATNVPSPAKKKASRSRSCSPLGHIADPRVRESWSPPKD
jgi:hypothetical protein